MMETDASKLEITHVARAPWPEEGHWKPLQCITKVHGTQGPFFFGQEIKRPHAPEHIQLMEVAGTALTLLRPLPFLARHTLWLSWQGLIWLASAVDPTDGGQRQFIAREEALR